ncbi:TSC22 domain family protein 1-like isoform X1 [Notolabrus celidotus]|uniref:TSC22 domain family protein 1-like isoform X1 n=1 Tax=Notolabrus celidotus TaxID=1203425 RepID=UPI00148FA0C6|nr:TSC22 domain family protein 1-like isoform X1 [Notolabrus celidotus]XP_034533461.1 TSC22 domain family protein 1-like isoform X1 [Notolabrus celidotus]XP_034533462.1 TSC22 domain family protein 1-like isoform X1 [Notolabrus celidotus]XP_034533463.1 TSC22 domain family protein 1-like isoform X1 [Notolabrus celidotus]
MHHQDFSGDPQGSGSRKSSFHFRRGSSGASGVSSVDDTSAQAGSSSPGLHHHQQQNQQQQSQASAGAQVKKKSGFQITSVTSAQINVSGNNSLADDTESYDDMDESHTEDLSSSDMLDVSVSKATDTGVPERSSSDETLNSLHGVDTPGLVSPNEPLHPHSIPQGSQQHASMVNGTLPHHYYPQPHQHHSDSQGGGEPALPIAPLATSSPAMKTGSSLTQRPDNTKPAGVTTQPLAAVVGVTAGDPQLQGGVNISNISAISAAAASSSDNTIGTGQGGGGQGPSAATAPNTQPQPTQTQAATGSRFRVVKLDTNSEPFRKGRWTCTEYYEKEVPHQATAEAPKGAEVAAETEAGNTGINQGIPAVQPPHTLQPYQQPSQDFTSPQAMQSPPQGMAQATPLAYVSPQEMAGGAHMQKPATAVPQTGVSQPPPAVLPQQLPYAVDPHQAQPQGGYPGPQLHGGVMGLGNVRQPDFIQPTAPFQTQVQPPPPHVTTGLPITPVPGVPVQPAVGITQQLAQGQVAPPAQGAFTGHPQTLPAHPQPQIQPHSTATVPTAPIHGNPYMPLTAVLQPLLAHGAAAFANIPGGGSSFKASHLEDAQKLLLQHQGLLGFPRLGAAAAGGEGAGEIGVTAGTLAHMGMSAEASAFMVAAAAGLRTQHAEGEDDSSSGASVVAIDNKIEQAMDLVKSHLMYAVREEVEVLKEQIKELIERNTQLEQENNLLKNLASPEQMAQFQAQVQTGGSPTGTTQPPLPPPQTGTTQALPPSQSSGTSA